MKTAAINENNKTKSVLADKLRMILFVLIMGAVCAGLLVVIDYFTSMRVERNEQLEVKASVLEVFGIDYEKTDIDDKFDENVKTVEKSSLTFYQANNGDVSYLFDGTGLWGDITGIMAVDSAFESVKGIMIIDQEETPGLGSRITEKGFLDQFKEKKIEPSLVVVSGLSKASKDNEVDAISGATLTSKALETILNENIQKYKEVWIQ